MNETHDYPGLEARAREIAEDLKPKLAPADIGFTVFLFHFGEGGGMAYVSSAERPTMIRAVVEWLHHQSQGDLRREVHQAFEDLWFTRKGRTP